MVKSDRWIRKMAQAGMIEPFSPEKVSAGVSFGLGSYGYDFTAADEFKVFVGKGRIGPRTVAPDEFCEVRGPVCEIPAGTFCLARSREYFRIPRDVLAVCFGKSTYARCGIVVTVTPLEPEWEGHITIQVANVSSATGIVYAGEGIGQVVFLAAESVCERSYLDLAGKYQRSSGIVLPR